MSIDLLVADAVRVVIREEIRAALAEQRGASVGDALVSYKEAAHRLGYHVSTITKWAGSGLLPTHGRGKGTRVYWSDVLKALELSSAPRNATKTAGEIANDILSKPKLRRVR